MYICITLVNHFDVQWKLIQHFKSTILQKKKKSILAIHECLLYVRQNALYAVNLHSGLRSAHCYHPSSQMGKLRHGGPKSLPVAAQLASGGTTV